MVLEALDKIKEAEQTVTELQKAAEETIAVFEQKCQLEIKQLQEESQQRVKKNAENLEEQQNNQLLAEKEVLIKEAVEASEQFEEQFRRNQEKMTNFILERVKKLDGSQ